MKINGNPDGGGGGVIEGLSITSNGIYTAGGGVDGYSPVEVDVQPELQNKTVIENGEYNADQGYYGLGTVTVSVPSPEFVTETLNVSVNNTYYPGTGVDGFSQVVVDVPQSVTGYTEKQVTEAAIPVTNLNNSASYVGSVVFNGNLNVQTVNLPNCKIVYNSAFQNCTNLTSVDLPTATSIYSNAFNYCTKLSYINIPNVSRIYDNAFMECRSLSYVSLPNIQLISKSAFKSCQNLLSIELPYVTSLSNDAFQSCLKLESVSAPELKYIPETGTFYNCSALTDVYMPKLLLISSQVFQSCYSLPHIDLPDCIIIRNSAFANCSSLSYINAPNLTAMDDNVIQSCSSLEYLDFPLLSAYWVRSGSFPKISYINIENGSLANNNNTLDFRGYTSLMEVSFGTNLYFVPKYPSFSTTFIASGKINIDAAMEAQWAAASGWSSLSSLFSVKGDANIPMLSVSDGVLYGKTGGLYGGWSTVVGTGSITTVSLPNCKILGQSAFINVSSLKDVYLPECKVVRDGAINNCSNVTTIYLPECEHLECGNSFGGFCISASNADIYLGASRVVGFTPFNGSIFGSLKTLYVPESLVSEYKSAEGWSRFSSRISPMYSAFIYSNGFVSGWAFNIDSTFTTKLGITTGDVLEVSLSKLRDIESGAFAGCTNLSTITLGYNSIVNPGSDMFSGCTALTRVNVPEDLYASYITAEGWSEYSSILYGVPPELSYNSTTFTLYGTTTSIDSNFKDIVGMGASNVRIVSLPNCTSVGNSTFYSHSSLSQVYLPECSYIGYGAFGECKSINSVVLPKCEYMDKDAFRGAGQNYSGSTTLDLPVCSYIGESAFYYGRGFKSIYLRSDSICQLGGINVFIMAYTNLSIYVPASLVDAYKSAQYWSIYTNKIFPIE